MSARSYVSKDGHWRVSVVSLDKRQIIRICYDSPVMPARRVIPERMVADGRCGILRTPDGYLVAEVTDVADIARYVPLEHLTPANP